MRICPKKPVEQNAESGTYIPTLVTKKPTVVIPYFGKSTSIMYFFFFKSANAANTITWIFLVQNL